MEETEIQTCDCLVCGGGEKKDDKQILDEMNRLWRSHPWAYQLGPMSEPQRKFYDPDAKREK